MTIITTVSLSVLFFTICVYFYFLNRKLKKKLNDAEKQISQLTQLVSAQKDFDQVLSVGISAFLHVSIKKSLERLESTQKLLEESENLNEELTNWATDFGKLTQNVYKQLKSIDERGIFEKDDDIGFLFQDMLDIITQYNSRVNNIQNDDRTNAIDEKQR